MNRKNGKSGYKKIDPARMQVKWAAQVLARIRIGD